MDPPQDKKEPTSVNAYFSTDLKITRKNYAAFFFPRIKMPNSLKFTFRPPCKNRT